MLTIIKNLIGFFNVIIIENRLKISKFDYRNNIVTVQQESEAFTRSSFVDGKIFTQKQKDIPVVSVGGDQ